MNRAMNLKAAAFQKARKVQMAADKATEAERRRKQWEWDHFEPMIYGGFSGTSAEFDEIYQRAKAGHQNIFFGDNTAPRQTQTAHPMRRARTTQVGQVPRWFKRMKDEFMKGLDFGPTERP